MHSSSGLGVVGAGEVWFPRPATIQCGGSSRLLQGSRCVSLLISAEKKKSKKRHYEDEEDEEGRQAGRKGLLLLLKIITTIRTTAMEPPF